MKCYLLQRLPVISESFTIVNPIAAQLRPFFTCISSSHDSGESSTLASLQHGFITVVSAQIHHSALRYLPHKFLASPHILSHPTPYPLPHVADLDHIPNTTPKATPEDPCPRGSPGASTTGNTSSYFSFSIFQSHTISPSPR